MKIKRKADAWTIQHKDFIDGIISYIAERAGVKNTFRPVLKNDICEKDSVILIMEKSRKLRFYAVFYCFSHHSFPSFSSQKEQQHKAQHGVKSIFRPRRSLQRYTRYALQLQPRRLNVTSKSGESSKITIFYSGFRKA